MAVKIYAYAYIYSSTALYSTLYTTGSISCTVFTVCGLNLYRLRLGLPRFFLVILGGPRRSASGPTYGPVYNFGLRMLLPVYMSLYLCARAHLGQNLCRLACVARAVPIRPCEYNTGTMCLHGCLCMLTYAQHSGLSRLTSYSLPSAVRTSLT